MANAPIYDSPLPDSPFLSVRDTLYVGGLVCRDCHAEESDSYRKTGMGRSLARATPDSQPPDGLVDHPPSQRRYQVARREGQLWHRELLRTDGPEEITLAE